MLGFVSKRVSYTATHVLPAVVTGAAKTFFNTQEVTSCSGSDLLSTTLLLGDVDIQAAGNWNNFFLTDEEFIG